MHQNGVRKIVHPKHLTEALEVLKNPTVAGQMLTTLAQTNPELASWISDSTASSTRTLVNMMYLHPGGEPVVRQMITKARMETFLVTYVALMRSWMSKNILSPEITVDVGKAYEEWLAGNLAEAFYPQVQDKTSPSFKARKNFLAKKKERHKTSKAALAVSEQIRALVDAGMSHNDVVGFQSVPFLIAKGKLEERSGG